MVAGLEDHWSHLTFACSVRRQFFRTIRSLASQTKNLPIGAQVKSCPILFLTRQSHIRKNHLNRTYLQLGIYSDQNAYMLIDVTLLPVNRDHEAPIVDFEITQLLYNLQNIYGELLFCLSNLISPTRILQSIAHLLRLLIELDRVQDAMQDPGILKILKVMTNNNWFKNDSSCRYTSKGDRAINNCTKSKNLTSWAFFRRLQNPCITFYRALFQPLVMLV